MRHPTLVKLSKDPTDPVSVGLFVVRREPLHDHILELANKEIHNIERQTSEDVDQ